jgi:hypothetical protein
VNVHSLGLREIRFPAKKTHSGPLKRKIRLPKGKAYSWLSSAGVRFRTWKVHFGKTVSTYADARGPVVSGARPLTGGTRPSDLPPSLLPCFSFLSPATDKTKEGRRGVAVVEAGVGGLAVGSAGRSAPAASIGGHSTARRGRPRRLHLPRRGSRGRPWPCRAGGESPAGGSATEGVQTPREAASAI